MMNFSQTSPSCEGAFVGMDLVWGTSVELKLTLTDGDLVPVKERRWFPQCQSLYLKHILGYSPLVGGMFLVELVQLHFLSLIDTSNKAARGED